MIDSFSLRSATVAGLLATAASLAACNGGGNSTQLTGGTPFLNSPSPQVSAVVTPSPSPGPVAVNGVVVAIPAGTYGSGAPQTPLSGAVVVVGPVLVAGATAPPVVPPGDASATTDSSGNYAATVPGGPAAPVSAQAAFVPAPNDLSGVTPPAGGYYISVFAPGSDGKSAGAPVPAHAFAGVGGGGSLGTQRVTTASADEANFLALVNRDRTTANPSALPMQFDETAEEAARRHTAEEVAGNFYCHYNAQNVGPTSRFLALFGIGQDDENIGKTSGQDVPGSYTAVEAQFMAEAATNGGHYANIIDSTHAWAGVSTLVAGPTAQYVDQEFVSPHGIAPYTYPNFAGSACPAGVYENNS